MFARKSVTTALVAAGLCLALAGPARADEAALLKRIDQLAEQLKVMQDELARVKADAAAAKQAAQAATPAPAPAPVAAASKETVPAQIAAQQANAPFAFPQVGPSTVLSSYGEIAYSRPTNNTSQTSADVARFVLGFQHRFGPKTKVVAELEVEHAVSSADDSGEVEVEQMYIEQEFTPNLSAKAGLFLIPLGLLNENHEPTAYYGVFRNFVETSIIPTTWREIGLGATYRTDDGLQFDAGVVTGFNLSKWDPNSDEGRASPLGSIHQEGQLALAKDLSVYAAVNYRGIPGLLVGGGVFYGGAGQGQDFAASNANITLYEGHVRWTPGAWDLSALYSRGTISNTAALNQTYVGLPTPVPQSFDGWYTQAAYRVWGLGEMSAVPFARYSQFNTSRSYVGLPEGLEPPTGPTNKVTTVGVNFYLNPGVVFKADYQWFQPDSGQNRFDLGVGYSF